MLTIEQGSWIVHLDKIHDGEPVLNSRFRILHHEIIPLGVFVGVQIEAKPQLVVTISTE